MKAVKQTKVMKAKKPKPMKKAKVMKAMKTKPMKKAKTKAKVMKPVKAQKQPRLRPPSSRVAVATACRSIVLVSAAATADGKLVDADVEETHYTVKDLATLLITVLVVVAVGFFFGVGMRLTTSLDRVAPVLAQRTGSRPDEAEKRSEGKIQTATVGSMTELRGDQIAVRVGAGRDVGVQGPVTYARWRSTPRFVPLGDYEWGAQAA